MLRWRLISGSVMIALLVILGWLDARADRPGIYLALLAIVLCVLATGEMLQLLRAAGGQPLPWAVYTGTLLPVLAASAPIAWSEYPADCPIGGLGWLACGQAAGLVVALAGEMWRHGARENPLGATIANLSQAALSILYLGGMIGFLVQLRWLPTSGATDPGLVPLLSLIFVVKLSDTGQYFFGRRFGQRKLAPVLSPAKTWEGALGGIGISVLITATLLTLYLPAMEGAGGWLRVLVYCLLISCAGLMGDLAESLLKRDAGVKDSSSWLPGLGGVLDMLDSLLLAAPVAYACWVFGLIAV